MDPDTVDPELFDTVGKLMHVFGDQQQPDELCKKLVFNVLYQQLMWTLEKARQTANQRGSAVIESVDFLFLFRKHPFHIVRIFNLAKSLDLIKGYPTNAHYENDDVDLLSGETIPCANEATGKESQIILDSIKLFDANGELQNRLENPAEIDSEKRERLKRYMKRISTMNEIQYQEFTKARSYSFCVGHAVRRAKILQFLNWLDNPNVSSSALIILNYIASEMIFCIVESALWVRDDERCGMVADPSTGEPLLLRHYYDALRKNKAFVYGGNLLFGSFH